MKPREVRVEFHIDNWPGNGEDLEDAIDFFGEFFGVTLTSIGMAGQFPGREDVKGSI